MGIAKSTLIGLEVLAFAVYAGGVALSAITSNSGPGMFEGAVLSSLVLATGLLLVIVVATDRFLP